ncbi:MAG TPA: iron ABC transporter substrate-binding protein [Hyphomicrobiaceae bacterium]|nr:iron ABC transporter substrate-binding protein [Hyphomicrobiaceae bacterium]
MHDRWLPTSRSLLAFLLVAFEALAALATAAAAQDSRRTVIDSAGRSVEIPQPVTRVLAAGPPASILLYTLAPEKMAGWVRAPRPAEKAFLAESVRELPEHGRLTGRGSTANLEVILRLKPDLIIDVGSVRPTYVSLADNVQAQTRIPYLLLDGSLDKTPEIYRRLGEWLGAKENAERLARYAEETLAAVGDRIAKIPDAERPRVYYARGVDGLVTGLGGSINMEVLERVGAVNVAAAAGRGGLTRVSIEQVLAWNPEVILVLDPAFYRSVQRDPLWSSVKAVRDKRVYLAPNLPYGWFDSPPGVNRLIGIRWLASVLYPRQFPESLRDMTRSFYKLFYHVDLTNTQLDGLLASATAAKPER